MYRIEELIEIFTRHGKQREEIEEEEMKKHQELYPNEPLPDRFSIGELNISKALAEICKEIHLLKQKMEK